MTMQFPKLCTHMTGGLGKDHHIKTVCRFKWVSILQSLILRSSPVTSENTDWDPAHIRLFVIYFELTETFFRLKQAVVEANRVRHFFLR